jgi:hypothetical protein
MYSRQPAGAMPVYTAKVVSDQGLTDIYAFPKAVPPPAAKRALYPEIGSERVRCTV